MFSSPSDPQAAALLAHVVSQMQQNVDFLVSQNYISSADASAIVARLPPLADTNNSTSRVAHATTTPAPARRSVPQRPAPQNVVQARAIWAYNEKGQEPEDLSFAAGDIIEIVAETNEDWWMGKVHGKQALFPSTYVEKITQPGLPPSSSIGEKAGAYNNKSYAPPAAQPDIDTPGPNSLGLQPAPGQEEKKKGFSKYKNTLAHSAAGGVGFGAGAAIGGGLVRAIF